MSDRKHFVTSAHVEHAGLGQWVTEASDLGLGPGEWPERIGTNLGNGQPFVRRQAERDDSGEITGVRYEQDLGCTGLLVIND
jgi:hypothetical protein